MSHDPLTPTEEERARIRAFTAKLKPSALKYLTLSLTDSETTQTNFYEILTEHFHSNEDKHWREQTVALWGIGFCDIPEEKCEETTTVLREILAGRNRSKRKSSLKRTGIALLKTARNTLVAYFVFRLLNSFLLSIPLDDPISDGIMTAVALASAIAVVGGILTLFLSFPISVSQDISRINETRVMAAKSLMRQNAIEAMPEILQGAMNYAPAIKEECRMTLCHFLPQITKKNRNVLPLNSENLIAKILNDTWNLALCEAIVDYLEKLGQGSSWQALTQCHDRLTHNLSHPDALAELEKLIEKSERVLALLHERQTQDNARQELLRHSAIPTTQPDQLLRPAADSQTTPAEQLLRASNAKQ